MYIKYVLIPTCFKKLKAYLKIFNNYVVFLCEHSGVNALLIKGENLG